MFPPADPSSRYVLPTGAPYLNNLAALWAADPRLAEAIEALPEGQVHRIEPTKSGLVTLALPRPGGGSVYLHSRYQPLDEAQRLIAAAGTETCTAFYVHGFGLGYHIEALFDASSDEAVLAVFEPDLRLLRLAFEQRDFSRLIESKRLLIFWKADKAELFNRLQPHFALFSLGTQSLKHPPSLQLHSAFHAQTEAFAQEFDAFCQINVSTILLNGRRTAENISRNIGWYAATPGPQHLKDRYRGKPAIVVSAGPSLRKNKHLLADAQGKAVIIAVQTTLLPLLEMGIEPQFVTSLDWSDLSTRFFERLPRRLKTELVAEPKAAGTIFGMHPGPITMLGNDFAETLLREMNLKKATLKPGATVAHLAFYLAEHLGCDPVIFIGQDLGFSDGLCYTPGTSYDDVWRPELSRFCTVEMKQWEQIARDRALLRQIPDHQGRPMYTEQRLYSYLQQFERDFAGSRRTIIDATEGGALKRGAEVMALSEALARFCNQPLDDSSHSPQAPRWNRLPEALRCLERRKEEAREIEQVSRQTLPLLQEVLDHLDDTARVNRIIARLDALRNRISELNNTYENVVQLSSSTEMERFKRDRQIAAAKLEGAELQRRQVQRDIDNVRGVIAAAEQFQRLMDEVAGRLNQMQSHHRLEAA